MSTKEESFKCTGTLHTTTKSNPGKDNCCLPSSSPAYDPPRSGVRGPRLLASHPSAQQPPPPQKTRRRGYRSRLLPHPQASLGVWSLGRQGPGPPTPDGPCSGWGSSTPSTRRPAPANTALSHCLSQDSGSRRVQPQGLSASTSPFRMTPNEL